MAENYTDELLQEINANANLLEYVSQSLELEKHGNDYFAKCPMHIDKTPSLSFTPEKNSYYCFSCGRSGGMIGYLMDFEGLSLDDAVEKAARLAHIDTSTLCFSKTISFLRSVKKLRECKKQPYTHEIIDLKEYEKYTDEPIKEWIAEGVEPEVMELFGVKADNFQNRIIYPVYDLDGNLINIKGRTRYPNFKALKIPKYINYYTVGCMDYFQGLNVTLPYVRESNEIIVFESIKSVMKAFGWGYKNCASAEKHTLTDEQIALLAKLNVNVVFAYDSDIDYQSSDVKRGIDKLKRITNVFIIQDTEGLLGGTDTKNSPVDLGRDTWEILYYNKKKVVR